MTLYPEWYQALYYFIFMLGLAIFAYLWSLRTKKVWGG